MSFPQSREPRSAASTTDLKEDQHPDLVTDTII